MEVVLADVLKVVRKAQENFRKSLEQLHEKEGGLTQERYVRYLSMQYHLTKNVQRPFLTIAGHPDMGQRREFRKFLVNFANEEEFHYLVAAKDLEHLGVQPHPIPFDVELWWAYFDKIINDRPFVRLGATCVLENLSGGAREVVAKLFADAKYLNPKNTVFFRIHQHDENLPHGDQILEALEAAKLEPHHIRDLKEGAEKGAILYMRMATWALYGDLVYGLE